MNELMHTLCSVIKEQPLSQNLTEEAIRNLAEQALNEGKFGDEAWLIAALEKEQENIKLQAKESSVAEMLSHIYISPQAKIQSPEDLEFVLKKHQNWMLSVLDPKSTTAEGRANLRGANLQGYDLSGKNLSCADLSYCDLQEANLSFATLSSCKLVGANLSRANLRGAILKRVDLSECILEGTIFDD